MPTYYFDVEYHRGTYRDDFGDSFNDDLHASDQAQAIVSRIIFEHLFDDGFKEVICRVRNSISQSIYRCEGSLVAKVPD